MLTSCLDLSSSPTAALVATLVLLDLSTRVSSLLAVTPTVSHSPPVGAGVDVETVAGTGVKTCRGREEHEVIAKMAIVRGRTSQSPDTAAYTRRADGFVSRALIESASVVTLPACPFRRAAV